MSCLLNTIPDTIQSFEPLIGCCLVTDLSPDALLSIQAGLIRGQIFQLQTPMDFEESFDFFALVPTGPIDIQPNRIPSELAIEMSQTLQESLPVALGNTEHALSSQQGSHPTEDVQPFTMLASGWDSQSFSSFSPTSTRPGMEAKARFILKDDRSLGPQITKFFLKPYGTSEHPWLWPVNTNNSPVSPYTQADASSVAPVESLSLSQADALNAPPMSAHPNEPDLAQTLTGTSPNLSLISSGYLLLIYYAALAHHLLLMLVTLARLPHASIDLNSAASNLKRRLSILVADPPGSATGPLFSILPRPQGLSSHRLPDAPELPPDALNIMSDFSYINIIIACTLCKFVYDVCISLTLRLPASPTLQGGAKKDRSESTLSKPRLFKAGIVEGLTSPTPADSALRPRDEHPDASTPF